MRNLLVKGGEAGVRNVGTFAQRPQPSVSIWHMPFFATDVAGGTLYQCEEIAAEVFGWQTLATGGGALSGDSVAIYRQGVVAPSGNVFGSLAAAHAAATAAGLPALILVDGSLGAPVTTPGTYAAPAGVEIAGYGTTQTSGLIFNLARGTHFSGPVTFSGGLTVTNFNQLADGNVMNDLTGLVHVREGAQIRQDATATAHFVASPVNGVLQVLCNEGTINAGSATATVFADATATATVLMGLDSAWAAGSIDGTVSVIHWAMPLLAPATFPATVTLAFNAAAFIQFVRGTFAADASLVNQAIQFIAPGSRAATSLTLWGGGVLQTVPGFVSELDVAYIGDGANVGGQTATVKIQRSADGGATWADITGATTAALPTTAGVKTSQVQLTVPVAVVVGDILRAVVTIGVAPLTAVLTNLTVGVK